MDLLDLVVLEAQAATGHNTAERMVANGIIPKVKIKTTKPPRWTDAEIQFLRENLGILSIDEIAVRLGRSPNAVKIKFTRIGLPPPSRHPEYLNGQQIAKLMGIDSHIPIGWIDAGILAGEYLPTKYRKIRRVRWLQFKLWLVRPTSWIYFDPRKIKNDSLRHLVELAQARWNDEWWSTSQVAQYHRCHQKNIIQRILRGKIPGAVQAYNRSGRHSAPHWAYWFIPKSQATVLKIRQGYKLEWSTQADEFILRARAEGKTYAEIARMMKRPQKQVERRGRVLWKQTCKTQAQIVAAA